MGGSQNETYFESVRNYIRTYQESGMRRETNGDSSV